MKFAFNSLTRQFSGGLAAMLFALPAAAHAEAAPPDRPLLWRVDGDGLENPSHLFGTIHLSNDRIRQFHPATEAAFGAADAVFTEISMDAGDQMAAAILMMRRDGMTLSESIGPDLTAQLGDRLGKIQAGFDVATLDPLKTWAVAATVMILPHQLKGEPALDAIIWERAKAEEKQTAGLEMIRDQIAAFETLDEADQILYLKSLLDHYEEGSELLDQLIAAYATGEEAKLEKLVADAMIAPGEDEELQKIGDRLMDALLAKRDVIMAAKIDEWLTANPGKSGFFAVGAAHYLGDNSIRKHLEDKGYRVTPVVPQN